MINPRMNGFQEDFPGYSRFDFPDRIIRVTAGEGGETFLIIGSEKVALYDCGMACFAEGVISNIHEMLDPLERKVDFLLVSHTHYDHIGALKNIIDEWPDVKVVALEKAAKVFQSETAISTMERLGRAAAETYGVDCVISARGLRTDIIVKDGDEISLGDRTIKVYETKGHTDDSVCYMVLPDKILFCCESTGIVRSQNEILSSPLKSFRDSIESAKKLKALDIDSCIVQHYGILPKYYTYQYFDDYIENVTWEYNLIKKAIKNGLDDEAIVKVHECFFWTEKRKQNQPYPAYNLNVHILIKQVRKELENN